jgi:hypothetical protein
MSTIEAVTAIKLLDQPCCVEILVAHVDHSLPEGSEFDGIMVFPDEHGVITLDLQAAQALRARLDVAIRALEQRDAGANGRRPRDPRPTPEPMGRSR